MTPTWYSLLLLVGSVSLCRSQVTFNLGKVTAALDKNNDGNITRSEVDSFYSSYLGSSPANRCTFVDLFVDNFGGLSLRVSAFFDLIQSKDRQAGLAEIENTFLGNPNSTGTHVGDLTARIKALENTIDEVIARPAGSTVGPTFWPYSVFDIMPWANNYDADNDGSMSRLEISAAMRGLDQNGDGNIQRCEYIDSMALNKQHSVTSSKVYDIIFTTRDISWADVDSDFLILMIGMQGDSVTKQQFIDFFVLENLRAAGIPISVDGSIGGDGDTSAQLIRIPFWLLTSSFLGFLISTYLR